MAHDFKNGDRVSFLAGPRSIARTTATVTGMTQAGPGKGNGAFLVTKDDTGAERKVRPGSATRVVAA